MTWHSQTPEQIAGQLDSDLEKGLSPSQAADLLGRVGENKLQGKKPKTLLQRFLAQLKDTMVIILMLAAVVSTVMAFVDEHGDFLEPVVIVGIVLLNACLGVAQESKAEKALEALKDMSTPHARVIRGGQAEVISSTELVPGDIIVLEAGDFVPADARLISASSLQCEESALTGESVPVQKEAAGTVPEDAPLGDRHNMVYSGCSVSYGRGTAIVTSTGMSTQMGSIAALLSGEEDGQTPLQHKLEQMGKILGLVALAVCAVIFVIGLLGGTPIGEILLTAISLAVAAIPEGLPAIVTIVLAMGVSRMVKKNAIIRRLPAVETLGSASVICSDKTGTLTQNRMTVLQTWVDGEDRAEDISREERPSDPAVALLKLGTLCCDGTVSAQPDGTLKHIGDPTETAIVAAALRAGEEQEALNAAYPRQFDLPFDSDRKLMTTVNLIDDQLHVIVKGAFDILSERCVAGDVETARRINEEMGGEALRVICVAHKVIPLLPLPEDAAELEQGLTLMGLIGMIDPPREEARDAIATCLKAGIRPVMITGDHVVTASAIARQMGILKEGERAITGAELAAMSEEELDRRIAEFSVYARVTPEDKIRIVKAWQKNGQIVSMTGDGVNDAPALKAADIGCAMGITGTDVAKGAADMVLTDDNFATIVVAVKEGRGIFQNIVKSIEFLLSCNIGEILTVLGSMLLSFGSPLTAIQLLWVNLVTDGLPALALGMDPVDKHVMDEPPRPKSQGIFNPALWVHIVLQGLMIAGLTVTGYALGRYVFGSDLVEEGRTMAFLVLACSQLVHVYNIRAKGSLFAQNPFANKYLNGAVLCSLALILLVSLIPPVAGVFGMYLLPAKAWLAVAGLSLLPIPLVELGKLVCRVFAKK